MSFQPSQSFNEIYTAYYTKAFLYVKSYVHDDMVAEDIVSDSLIKLWEKLKIESIDPIVPYLFIMLKNRSLDFLKHQKTKENIHSIIGTKLEREIEIRRNSLEASDPNVVFSNEVKEIIEKTLNSLTPRTREVFVMSRFEGKSHKEIATALDISVKGVDYHIAQTVRALKLALVDYLPVVSLISLMKL